MESKFNIPVAFPANVDYSRQAVEVPGTRKPGQTGHYRSTAYPFLTLESPGALTTCWEIFEEGLSRSNGGPCLGRRPLVSKEPLKFADYYVWESWAQIDTRRRAIGSALHNLFKKGTLGGGQLETVGIWSRNTPEWQLLDCALHAYAKIGVALYDTLGKDSVEYIINHAETTVVFATSEHAQFLLKLAPSVPRLKMVVIMDDIPTEAKDILVAWGKDKNVQVLGLLDLEAMGAADLVEPIKTRPDQLATICYTSGTTGNPKGALLTHGNLANAVNAQLSGYVPQGDDICAVSYLPLAHIYERVMALCNLAMGGRIGYSTGDPLRLLEDMQILKPTFVATVPRVLNRVYQVAMANAEAPGLKGMLFRHATEVKLQQLRATGQRTHALWDRLVFRKVAAAFGGRVQLMSCGSAPISSTAMDFLRMALLGDLLEGYGMTENGGTCTHVWQCDPSSSGTVGPPLCNTEIKLIDVPSMGYSAEDKPFPRGEICFRGDHSFKGYYKDEKNTKATIDADGWIHTGDVGLMDKCGRLKIIDRVKNIMKLAQGEYVALENIENVYSSCPLVAQVFVYGDSLQSYLLAVVVPDPVLLSHLLSKLGRHVSSADIPGLQESLSDPKVNAAVLSELTKTAQENKLKGFEMVKRVYLTMEPFTVDNGCLTPTFKIKRKETYERYKNELNALYALPLPTSAKL
ncbi:acetyl-CoA synthetase-like protein [Daedalea quercina L-15889]|uniref:Acetyl-CoA synthetase-like protein n=1 Tax=Daedalea quercina L-15889 TaxID=1314783 RepID=A0A165Q528_9APHY|nr:acetyl-CoA synthetase-like protein [Daedalea quercina L-15889]